MRLRSLAFLAASIFVSACTPTPGPAGNPTTACTFPANQTSNGLRMNCTVTGPLPNMRLDPFVQGAASCGINSWLVSGQTVNVPLAALYGANGDDTDARVRVDVTVGPGTHSGTAAKDNPTDNCATTVGSSFTINTTFSGTYVGVVDKGRTPMCVFQSRLTLNSFNQTITAGIPVDISGVTRTNTQNSLQKRIDLEIARAVNGLISPNSLPLSDAVVNRGGRCENDWQPFTGN